MLYRITVYDDAGEKNVIIETEEESFIEDDVQACLQDLFKGSLKSVVISTITGKAGIKDDV